MRTNFGVFLEGRLQLGERFRSRVRPNGFVAIHDDRRLALLRNGNRQDFFFEKSRLSGLRGLLVAARGVVVLRLTPDFVSLGDNLAGVAHVALFEGAPQPVVDHRVDDLAVAQP